jgi:hypothetical protein
MGEGEKLLIGWLVVVVCVCLGWGLRYKGQIIPYYVHFQVPVTSNQDQQNHWCTHFAENGQILILIEPLFERKFCLEIHTTLVHKQTIPKQH